MSWYLTISTVVSFIALMKVPTKMSGLDNVGGSVVVAIAFGWLLWPLFVIAAFKSRKRVKNA